MYNPSCEEVIHLRRLVKYSVNVPGRVSVFKIRFDLDALGFSQTETR
jgi:hypothetical protein